MALLFQWSVGGFDVVRIPVWIVSNAAFTLNGFDDQETKPDVCDKGFPSFKA